MKTHNHPCRIVTTKLKPKGRKVKVSRGVTTNKIGSGCYRGAAKEPWILATNLPLKYKASATEVNQITFDDQKIVDVIKEELLEWYIRTCWNRQPAAVAAALLQRHAITLSSGVSHVPLVQAAG